MRVCARASVFLLTELCKGLCVRPLFVLLLLSCSLIQIKEKKSPFTLALKAAGWGKGGGMEVGRGVGG